MLPILRLPTPLLLSLSRYHLPCRMGVCFGSWGGCTSVRVIPRKDRSRSKRPSHRLWLPDPREGSSRIIGLPSAADMASLSCPASLPGFVKLFTSLRESGSSARQKEEASESSLCPNSLPSVVHWLQKRHRTFLLNASLLQPPSGQPAPQKAGQCALTLWPLLIIVGLLAPSGSPQRPC